MSQENIKRKVNYTNSIYFSVMPIVCIFTTYHWLKTGAFNWNTIILGLILATFVELSITAGYHRLFAHRTYNAKWPVRLFFLIFGAAGLQGAAVQWALDHRDHHNYVDDNVKDPYSIGKGFFWAHMGWLFFKHNYQMQNLPKAGDLQKDPLVMWQFKYWIPLGIFVGYILPGIIAMAWGDFFGGVVIAGCLRSVINHHATFLINSLSHCVGKQTYSDSHSARDNWFAAFLTFGEGYHNYHHEFPSDYRNGTRLWDWDPTKWTIRGLSFLGLTSDLKRIREEIIVRKRLQMKEKSMNRKLEKQNLNLADFTNGKILSGLRDQVETTYKELSKLRDQYQKAAKEAIDTDLKDLNSQIEEARTEFLSNVGQWNILRREILAYAKA